MLDPRVRARSPAVDDLHAPRRRPNNRRHRICRINDQPLASRPTSWRGRPNSRRRVMIAAQAWTTDDEHSSPGPHAVDSGPIDILVADDEMIVRRLLEMVLAPSGVRLETVSNGAEAVRVFQEHHGDVRLVLLDVQMPVMDGPQTFRRLQE